MTQRPTRDTAAGRAYLDLQNLARRSGRPTDELHQLYALEGFLDRLTRSTHADRFVLKGGVLLAAFDSRRPTRDIDLSASAIANDANEVRDVVVQVLAVEVDDGLSFDARSTSAEQIRDGDRYHGIRVHASGQLSSARLRFHVDVNVGDPITPAPSTVAIPRLLGGDLEVVGYPIEMVLAEKIVTAIERGTANTRWRDFVDIAALAGNREVDADRVRGSIRAVADHREATLAPLEDVLAGYADLAQDRWARWRRKQHLADATPERFEDLLALVIALVDPLIAGHVVGRTWRPPWASWS